MTFRGLARNARRSSRRQILERQALWNDDGCVRLDTSRTLERDRDRAVQGEFCKTWQSWHLDAVRPTAASGTRNSFLFDENSYQDASETHAAHAYKPGETRGQATGGMPGGSSGQAPPEGPAGHGTPPLTGRDLPYGVVYRESVVTAPTPNTPAHSSAAMILRPTSSRARSASPARPVAEWPRPAPAASRSAYRPGSDSRWRTRPPSCGCAGHHRSRFRTDKAP